MSGRHSADMWLFATYEPRRRAPRCPCAARVFRNRAGARVSVTLPGPRVSFVFQARFESVFVKGFPFRAGVQTDVPKTPRPFAAANPPKSRLSCLSGYNQRSATIAYRSLACFRATSRSRRTASDRLIPFRSAQRSTWEMRPLGMRTPTKGVCPVAGRPLFFCLTTIDPAMKKC